MTHDGGEISSITIAAVPRKPIEKLPDAKHEQPVRRGAQRGMGGTDNVAVEKIPAYASDFVRKVANMPRLPSKLSLLMLALASTGAFGADRHTVEKGNAGARGEQKNVYLCRGVDGRSELTESAGPGCRALPDTTGPVRIAGLPQRSRPHPSMTPAQALDYAKGKVSYDLIDPDATRFREVRLARDGKAVCGQYNSKNLVGAYVGYRNFSVVVDTTWARGTVDISEVSQKACSAREKF